MLPLWTASKDWKVYEKFSEGNQWKLVQALQKNVLVYQTHNVFKSSAEGGKL